MSVFEPSVMDALDSIRGRLRLLNLLPVNEETARDTRIVYFVQAQVGGAIKIGRSTVSGMSGRLCSLQTGNPHMLVVRRMIIDEYGYLEGELHLLLSPWRIKGEWFHPCPEVSDLCGAVKGDPGLAGSLNEMWESGYQEGYTQGWSDGEAYG